MITISQLGLKRNLILVGFGLVFSFNLTAKELFLIKNSSGKSIELKLALTREEQTQGLSGIKAPDFKESFGMLFINPQMGPRKFWMPNTYFNLDIIFLDQNLKIVGIEKNVPSHPGLKEPPEIYKTDTYIAQFILEIKAGAKFGKTLKPNDQLSFIGPTSLSEIVLKTHQKQ